MMPTKPGMGNELEETRGGAVKEATIITGTRTKEY